MAVMGKKGGHPPAITLACNQPITIIPRGGSYGLPGGRMNLGPYGMMLPVIAKIHRVAQGIGCPGQVKVGVIDIGGFLAQGIGYFDQIIMAVIVRKSGPAPVVRGLDDMILAVIFATGGEVKLVFLADGSSFFVKKIDKKIAGRVFLRITEAGKIVIVDLVATALPGHGLVDNLILAVITVGGSGDVQRIFQAGYPVAGVVAVAPHLAVRVGEGGQIIVDGFNRGLSPIVF